MLSFGKNLSCIPDELIIPLSGALQSFLCVPSMVLSTCVGLVCTGVSHSSLCVL